MPVVARGYHRYVARALVPPMAWAQAALSACLSLTGCASGDRPPPPPQAWTGFFHPPPPPGASIGNSKQCACRACEPDSCCGAEQTETQGPAPAECNGSYTFSEKCGITVQTCTPRCYSHVWRVGNQESCSTSRPLICCE
jgi:hypothetical protein